MKEINWNEKPDWAIGHAVVEITGSEVWFNDDQYQYLHDGSIGNFNNGWAKTEFKDMQYPPEAEVKPEWNGEGLPPVGTVCEWKDFFWALARC